MGEAANVCHPDEFMFASMHAWSLALHLPATALAVQQQGHCNETLQPTHAANWSGYFITAHITTI